MRARPACGRILSVLIVAAAAALPAAAVGKERPDPIEACLEAASQVKSGAFVKVEKLVAVQGGKPTLEVEIRDSERIEWELMCSLEDARIYEIEREAVDENDQGFKAIAKLSEQEAVAIATAMYPGDVQEVEYEIEFNGDASYEIDVVDSDGKEFKIEVDAATGRIIELSLETWEIGEEPAERR